MNDSLSIFQVDPHHDSATTLMRALADEEAARYADLGPDPFDSFSPDDVLTARAVFVVAHLDGKPVGCGALRQIDSDTGEINRMYVMPSARKRGIARAILNELERWAARFGYRVIRAETGNRQPEAIALYESCGFGRTSAFGSHAEDPVSVFFAKSLHKPSM